MEKMVKVPARWLVEVYWVQLSSLSDLPEWSAGVSPHPACWSHGPTRQAPFILLCQIRKVWKSLVLYPSFTHRHTHNWPAQASACWQNYSIELFLLSVLCTQLASRCPPAQRSAHWHPAARCPIVPELHPSLKHKQEELMVDRSRW